MKETKVAELNPACSIVCLRKQTKKPSVCIAGFTSASGPWQPTAECCWLIVQVCSSTELRYDNLYCSLISSLGFPLASSPHPPILFTVQPSIILPLSESAAKLSGSWKQLFLYVWGDTTCSSDRLFSPHRSLVDGQADRLPHPPPPLLPSPWGKWSCSLKSEVRYLSPKPRRDSGPLISLTYRWSKAPHPQPVSVWNMLKQTEGAKAIKISPCAGLFQTRALWLDYKTLKVSTHLGITTALPDDVKKKKKKALHPSCFWITYFCFLPTHPASFFWSDKKVLSYQSSDLCLIWNHVFTETLLTLTH